MTPRTPGVEPTGDAAALHPRTRHSALRDWVRRRHLFIDPGYARLSDAIRTVGAVALAILIVFPLSRFAGFNAVDAAFYAGLIALFAAPVTRRERIGPHRWLGAVAVVPTVAGLLLGSLLPRGSLWIVVGMALVAALSAWVRRFGARIGGIGQLLFMSYYFALLLGLGPVDLRGGIVAAAMGLASTWIVDLLPGPGVWRQVEGGIAALLERAAALTDTIANLVSTGRPDPRRIRQTSSQLATLRRTATSLAGLLRADSARGITHAHAHVLRARVFDLELAAESLVALLPYADDVAITVEQRAHLSAALVELRQHLTSRGEADHAAASPRPPADPPRDWPSDVTRILRAVVELTSAVDRLHDIHAVQAHGVGSFGDVIGRAATTEPAEGSVSTETDQGQSASGRLAVQTGVAVGLALVLGSLISTSHQYWAALPAFQVLRGSDGETTGKGIRQVAAATVASGLAFGLAILTGHSAVSALVILGVSVFLTSFLRAVSPSWAVFWQTVLLATMYDVLSTLNVEAVDVRILETAAGAIVAVLVSAILLPTRTRDRVMQGTVDVVHRTQGVSDDLFARLLGTPTSEPSIEAQTSEIEQRLSRLEDLSTALRYNPGALQRTGIEAQLTAFWSLLAYERRIDQALGTDGDRSQGRVDWVPVMHATDDNFAAVQAVLAGELPQRVHRPADFERDLGTHATGRDAAVLTQVGRLNQSLLALIDALRPGTIDSMTTASTEGAAARP